jgi:hypothetical protein
MMSGYIKYKVRVYASGNKSWYLNGQLHREDGPAIEYVDGGKAWFLNGKRHREDGPAFEYVSGEKCWYLEDVTYSKSEHKAEMERRNNTCNGKTVTIEGKQYELTEVKQ